MLSAVLRETTYLTENIILGLINNINDAISKTRVIY